MNIILFDKLSSTNHIDAEDSRARHIKKVLRLNIGEEFSVGIINGPKGKATLTSYENGVDFTFIPVDTTSSFLYPVTLMVSQVRPICMKRILREAVSLGVERIVINGADLSEKSYAQASLYTTGAYKQHLLEGAMQAAQTGVSEVLITKNLDQALRLFSPGKERLIMLDNVIGAHPLSTLEKGESQRVILAIGPERGYSERERKLLVEKGFSPMSLGRRVLRTETACSAGLAVLLGRLGYL